VTDTDGCIVGRGIGDWTAELAGIGTRASQRLSIADAQGALTFGDVIGLWADDEAFRLFFTASLLRDDIAAFFWELPPVTVETLGRPFECVLVPGPVLETIPPDPSAFQEQLATGEEVVVFANLGGDAILVVPAPRGSGAAYGHLGSFLRWGPLSQRHRLWQEVGRAVQRHLSATPTWLSTAGLGVPWLHVRLDSRPKYYRHRPYKELP